MEFYLKIFNLCCNKSDGNAVFQMFTGAKCMSASVRIAAMAAVKTVKESVSGRLSGLKFMQRAKVREDEFKMQEGEVAGRGAADDSLWVLPAAASSQCKVIVEGNPKPGAVIGRMSFQNCNPSVERIVEEVQARRERIRNYASTFKGKEEKPVVSTPQNGTEQQKVDDPENLSMRKRQKVEKVEKLALSQDGRGEVEMEKSTTIKMNSFTALRGSENTIDKRQHKQQQQNFLETEQVNSRSDWRTLRPAGR